MKNIFLVFILISTINTKVIIVIDQKMERCSTFDKLPFNDLSKLNFIPVNDTHTFINGSWNFMKGIVAPWPVHLFAEHYVQGQWLVQAYDRNYKDFCEALKNPMEPWYFMFKDKQGCPLKAGTKWIYNMLPIEFSPMLLNNIPHHYMGRWRFTTNSKMMDNGIVKNECTRGFGDIYED